MEVFYRYILNITVLPQVGFEDASIETLLDEQYCVVSPLNVNPSSHVTVETELFADTTMCPLAGSVKESHSEMKIITVKVFFLKKFMNLLFE